MTWRGLLIICRDLPITFFFQTFGTATNVKHLKPDAESYILASKSISIAVTIIKSASCLGIALDLRASLSLAELCHDIHGTMKDDFFVQLACSERDIVVTTSVWCMCVHACVRPDLSGP